MEKSTIGIKIANGTFFPILEQIDNRKKKVILTPVKSGQKDVKIDIYRGEGQLMLNSTYVASIILNNIESIENESTDIQFFIKINDEGILDAEAFEPLSGEKQLLSISLDSIEENFSIDDSDEDFDTAFSAAINETIDEDEDEEEEEDAWLSEHENRNKGKGLKIAVIILAIIFIILLGMLIYALLVKPALAKNKEQVEVIETVVLIPEPAPVVEEPKPAPPAPVVEEPKPVPPAPVVEEPKPVPPAPVVEKPKKKAESVRYRIKWGDTLWDISDTYYRTPWLYKKIARDNKIRNPDYIWAGSMLTIKPEE